MGGDRVLGTRTTRPRRIHNKDVRAIEEFYRDRDFSVATYLYKIQTKKTPRFEASHVMSLICMMCSLTPLTLVIRMEENFVIKVLAKALSEATNCSLMDFSKSWTLSYYSIEPLILEVIFVLMNITLSQLDISHHSNSATSAGVLSSVTSGGFDFLMA